MRENLDGEIISGVLAGLAVSPLVAMVDKAMFSAASGKMPYKKSFKQCAMKLLVSPMRFLRTTTFKWCFVVYASTFVTANCADRLAKLNDLNVRETTFLSVSAVNITLNLCKDNFMTRRYSLLSQHGAKLPKGTMVCYAIRDAITIVGAFVCVEPVAERIQTFVYSNTVAKLISQSFCPIISQLLNTPFFIYGIDLYNRPKAKFWERLRHVRKSYWDTYYWSRVTRVGPAYSVGGILNMIFRFCFTQTIPKKTEEDENKTEDDRENWFGHHH